MLFLSRAMPEGCCEKRLLIGGPRYFSTTPHSNLDLCTRIARKPSLVWDWSRTHALTDSVVATEDLDCE